MWFGSNRGKVYHTTLSAHDKHQLPLNDSVRSTDSDLSFHHVRWTGRCPLSFSRFMFLIACSLQHKILTFCLTDTLYVTFLRQDTM
jgi:hypothetical protein